VGIFDSFKRRPEETPAKQAQGQAQLEDRIRQERAERAGQIEAQYKALVAAARTWLHVLPTAVLQAARGLDEPTLLSLYESWLVLGLSTGGLLQPRKGEMILGHAASVTRLKGDGQRIPQGEDGDTGVSIKLANGRWIRPDCGAPPTDEPVRNLRRIDEGQLYLTDRRVYFRGGEHNVDLRYASMETSPRWTQDGIVILANGPKEELFHVGDARQAQGWVPLIGLFQCVARCEAA
jgi:hypothetical protein